MAEPMSGAAHFDSIHEQGDPTQSRVVYKERLAAQAEWGKGVKIKDVAISAHTLLQLQRSCPGMMHV